MSMVSFLEKRGDGTPAVKICGITAAGDALAATEAGADAIGVNFWEGSCRYVRPEDSGWLDGLRGKVTRVGVFVNAPVELPLSLYEKGLIDVAQLHGDEDVGYRGRLGAADVPLVVALRIREVETLAEIAALACRYVLLDSYRNGTYGGTGKTFDWGLARRAVTENPDVRILLAGGLTPGNVRGAAEEVGPAAVDVAGGVEVAPGSKDAALVAKFISEVRAGSTKTSPTGN